MANKLRFSSLLVATCFLSACTTTSDKVMIQPSILSKDSSAVKDRNIEYDKSETKNKVTTLDPLLAQEITLEAAAELYIPEFKVDKASTLSVSANDLALADFLHLVLGEKLGINYVIDDNVKKKRNEITLNLPTAVTAERLYRLTVQLLKEKEIKLESKDGILFVLPQPSNATSQYTLGVGKALADIPVTAGQILQLIPIEYVDWGSLNRMLRQLTNAKVQFVDSQNAIMMTGTRKEIEQVVRVVNTFDKVSVRGRNITLIELVYMTPDEFKEQLKVVFDAEGITFSSSGNDGAMVITPLPRMRSILIHTNSKNLLKRVEYWAKQLDVPTSSDGKRYFTYFPQNVEAKQIGESISQLFGLKQASEQSENGKRAATVNSKGGMLSKDLAMAVDETQNALMFYTTPSQYHEIVNLIEQIDILPSQVLIEAAITEVTLEGNFSMGVDWSLASGNFKTGTQGGLGEIGGGLTYQLTGLDYSVTMAFLQGQSKVNILSRPRILVKDGKSATLNIGTEVPLLTQTSTDLDPNSDRVVQNVQYRTTGVNLNVTPTINAQGVISLKVSQTVSEAGENKLSGVDSPLILNRAFNTELLSRDGQTVVLGGLISENKSEGSSQVPVLGDIPILGQLFKTQSDSSNRVELVVMITPRIIKSDQDIDELLELVTGDFENLFPAQ